MSQLDYGGNPTPWELVTIIVGLSAFLLLELITIPFILVLNLISFIQEKV